MTTREEAAEACIGVFDEVFFRALAEPARIAIFREVVLLGEADIGAISNRLPQDRSVISRHLQILADAGILAVTKKGRQRIYRVDCPAITERLEEILKITKALQPHCCGS